MQPIDTVEYSKYYEVEGTDYVLVLDKHDEDIDCPERFEIYLINKNNPDFDVDKIYLMPQLCQATLHIIKKGFKIVQTGDY